MNATSEHRNRIIVLGLCSLALLAAAGSTRKQDTLTTQELVITSEDGSVNYRLAVEGDALVFRRLEPAHGHLRLVINEQTAALELVHGASDEPRARLWMHEGGAGVDFHTGDINQPSARLASTAEGAELALRGPAWGGAVIAEVNREAQGGRLQLGDKGPAVRLSPKPEGIRVEALREGAWTLVDELP